MRKIVIAESMTVDGVCEAQVFAPYQGIEERNEYMRETVFASDALLLGRTTYDQMSSSWPSQKNGMADRMNSIPKYVVSSTPLKAQWNNSTIIKGNVVEEIAKLKQQPGQDILIIGSISLAQSLMQTDLVDMYKLLVHPMLNGSGKHLFKDGMGMTKLKLVESKTLNLGGIVLFYEPTK